MKKILVSGVMLLLSLVFLTGCSDEEGIVLWLDDDDYAEALIQALQERFPDENFIYEQVGTVDVIDKLELDGPAGIGGDIMLIPHDHISNALQQNLLLPLGAELGSMMEERILESALGTVYQDGSYFGLPLTTESIALFYNKTLLEAYGLDVATSFEEIIEQAAVFNDESANRFILRWEVANAYHGHIFLTAAGFELFGPAHNDPDAVNLNTPAVVSGLEFYQRIRDILPVPAGDLDWASTHGEFVEGNLPYLISGPWSIAEIGEEGDFEWGITTIPLINGVQPISFSGNIIAVASSFTDEPDLVREILDFIVSDEGLQIMYEVRSSIPALRDASVINGLKDDPFLLGILAQAEHSHPMPVIPEMSHFWAVAPEMFEAVWEGLLTPAEAAERALNSFNESINLAEQ